MEDKKEKVVAVVLSAGRGKRMNSDVAKQYMEMNGKPVLYYSLKAFNDSFVDEIILVVGENDREYCQKQIIEKYNITKVIGIVIGGEERYDSVYNGLLAIKDCDYVMIHDGARPFVTEAIMKRNLDMVRKCRACVTGMPVKDTIKVADDNEFVQSTPKRKSLWQVQTPQTFSYSLILDAYQKYMADKSTSQIQATDDAMLAETYGRVPVKLVCGDYSNIKITTPDDLIFADAYLKART